MKSNNVLSYQTHETLLVLAVYNCFMKLNDDINAFLSRKGQRKFPYAKCCRHFPFEKGLQNIMNILRWFFPRISLALSAKRSLSCLLTSVSTTSSWSSYILNRSKALNFLHVTLAIAPAKICRSPCAGRATTTDLD